LILSEASLPADAPKVSVSSPDGSMYFLERVVDGKGVIIIARDRNSSGKASYAVKAGGYTLDGADAAAVAPGEVVILRAEKR
jgi:hypothetical protein